MPGPGGAGAEVVYSDVQALFLGQPSRVTKETNHVSMTGPSTILSLRFWGEWRTLLLTREVMLFGVRPFGEFP
jgi:hypothetical protein